MREIIDEDFYDNDELYLHLLIEFDNNIKSSSTRYQYIDEAKGMPNGIREDAEYLTSLIYDHVKMDKETEVSVDLSKMKMGFIFDELILIYSPNDTLYGETEHKIRFSKKLKIKLYANHSNCFNDVEIVVCHELLHAHAYILSGYDEDGYANLIKRFQKISYDRLFRSKTEMESFVKFMIYISNEDELNAFISQITLEIEQQKPHNPEESLKLLKRNSIYNSYCDAKNNLPSIANSKEFCEIWKSLVKDQSNMSDKKIILNLRRRFDNIQKRLNRIIPRICYENRTLPIMDIANEHFMDQFKPLFEKWHAKTK